MALLDQIQKDMTAAMKGREEARLDAIRMIKAALQRYAIDTMKPLDEAAELQFSNTLVKQRRESADMFRKGNRPELADKEEAELKLIESYMPSAPTDEEIDAALAAAIAETGVTSLKQMGVVMKAAQAKLAGKRVDGTVLSERVRSKLRTAASEILVLAEVVAHRHGGCRRPIASELVGEIRHIMQVELRTYEKAVREGDLEAGSEVDLEMVRTADRGNWFVHTAVPTQAF